MIYVTLTNRWFPDVYYDDSNKKIKIPLSAVEFPQYNFDRHNNKGVMQQYNSNKWIDYIIPALSSAVVLNNAKKEKLAEVETKFNAASIVPITDANSIRWFGGYDSGVKYDASKRIAELSGQSTVVFKDINGARHTLTIAEATAVILQVGADYLSKDAKFDNYVDAVKAATKQADLDAIVVAY